METANFTYQENVKSTPRVRVSSARRSNLDHLDNDGRREVLSMLRVKATATKERVVIRGMVEFPQQGDISYHCTNIGMTTWT